MNILSCIRRADLRAATYHGTARGDAAYAPHFTSWIDYWQLRSYDGVFLFRPKRCYSSGLTRWQQMISSYSLGGVHLQPLSQKPEAIGRLGSGPARACKTGAIEVHKHITIPWWKHLPVLAHRSNDMLFETAQPAQNISHRGISMAIAEKGTLRNGK
jgi:hypothetical protein